MLTRCPSCATHFRVTPDQLKLRAGRVRCGECQHVFNALDTLIEEPPILIAPTPAAVLDPPLQATLAPSAPDAEQIAELAVAPAPTFEATPEATPAPAEDATAIAPAESIESPSADDANAATAEPPGESATADHSGLSSATPIAADGSAAADVASAEVTPVPDQEQVETWDDVFDEPPAPRRWPWLLGSLCALLALGVQAIIMYRIELAVLWPEAKPGLVAACQALGCEVGLPAKVALVGIEASDLHPDTAQKGRLALTATLKNRAPFAQQFPHVELTLTDTADKAIVRKVLAPIDYLPRNAPIPSGMASNVDIAISIGLDAGELPASGYRLYIFYP